MKNKPLTTAILVIILMLLLLFWTYLLSLQTRRELREMRKLKDSVSLTLHTFNMRKSDLHLKTWENQRDMYINRNEIARIRNIMISKKYHIAMVPMLVPGEARVPKSVLKQLYSQGSREGD